MEQQRHVPHADAAIITAFTLTSFSTVVVALRFYSRYYLVGTITWSDYVMLAALITCWMSACMNWWQLHFSDFSLTHSQDEIFDFIKWQLLTWWIYRINYLVDLCLIKLSILLFYHYLGSAQALFRRTVRWTIALLLLTTVGMIILSVANCIPASDAWSVKVFLSDFTPHPIKARCFSATIIWYVHAGFNLVTDLWIWILPMPFLMNIRTMPLSKRLGLVGIFSIGIIAIVASAVRIWVLTLWTSTFQNTWDTNAILLIWAQVEQHAGIISASIPFLRPLLRRISGKVSQRREQPGRPLRIKSLGESPMPSPSPATPAPVHFVHISPRIKQEMTTV